jgi:transposase
VIIIGRMLQLDARLDPRQLLERMRMLEEQLAQRDQLIAQNEAEIARRDRQILWLDTKVAKLTHEMAVLRRWKFGRSRESLSAEQLSLIDEAVDADIAAIEAELDGLRKEIGSKPAQRQTPRREPLPAGLPRIEIRHEPEITTCTSAGCGAPLERIGEDVSEKLDYRPGEFSVERHVQGKWVCRCCERLVQAPMPAYVIDKGIPTARLLAQVLVSKYADHVPLARQETIYARAGVLLPRSTQAEWVGECGQRLQPLVDALRAEVLAGTVLHADETPVTMLSPGEKKSRTAYLWAYAPGKFEPLKAVIYDFCESRAGEHARRFLGDWRGALLVDDYAGYKKTLGEDGVIELGCLAHARRKFYDLYAANQSRVAADALEYFRKLYEVEHDTLGLAPEHRKTVRQERSREILDAMHVWLVKTRTQITDGSATARAIDYSLRRWAALTRYTEDGRWPIDNNHIEGQIRPIALGRKNWLFAGSLRAGRRAAAVMSLINSAKLNGLDPWAYLADVLERLPTTKMAAIGELLPHRWTPPATEIGES